MGLPTDLAGLINLGIREALFDSRTAVLAKVEKWYPAEQTIDALPLIKRKREIDEERLVDDYPVVTRVPVSFPRWGGFVIRMPLAAGDIVMLLVSDREIEGWLSSGGSQTVEPRGTTARRSLNDAIAIAGISTWSNPAPNLSDGHLVIGREDGAGEFRIDADGNVTIASNGEVRLSAGGDADQRSLRGEETLEAIRDLIAAFNAHTHTAPSGGGATTAPTPIPPPAPNQIPVATPADSLLSEKVKLK